MKRGILILTVILLSIFLIGTSGCQEISTSDLICNQNEVLNNFTNCLNKQVNVNGLTWTCYDFSQPKPQEHSWPCLKVFNERNEVNFINLSNNTLDLCYSEESINGVIGKGYKVNQNITVTGYLREEGEVYIEVTETSCKKNVLNDDLTDKCTASFNKCKEIVSQKYDLSMSLIKQQRFDSLDGVSEFLRTWQTFVVPINAEYIDSAVRVYCGGYCAEKLPLILFAAKSRNLVDNIPISIVLFCDKSGELTSFSKSQASC